MRIAVIIILIVSYFSTLAAQKSEVKVNFIYAANEQTIYHIGDTICLSMEVNSPPEICTDGMDKTKMYISGLSIISDEEWTEIKEGEWHKTVCFKVIKNNRNEGKITLLRKADKGDFFHQKKFEIEE